MKNSLILMFILILGSCATREFGPVVTQLKFVKSETQLNKYKLFYEKCKVVVPGSASNAIQLKDCSVEEVSKVDFQ